MKSLTNNWLTEGLIDFEYKKYILLAYLKEVKNNFDRYKLYPMFSDLIFHYQNLLILRDQKQLLKENFPERLSNTDFENMKVLYEKIIEDDETMNEIEAIINYSIPKFEQNLSEGKEIYEYFESNMTINPVGIVPLSIDEGYLLIKENEKKEAHVYNYEVSIFQNANEKYRAIHTTFIDTRTISISNTYEAIKLDLLKTLPKPNPATYVIESKVNCPMGESFLPIAKRMLIKYISTAQ
ncbi:MAG: hypothetical protein NW207_08555 [Cytophagales bacterium]|nr:hypothetical protein [Cytophagales bacterium]